jgi:hypothetical protein
MFQWSDPEKTFPFLNYLVITCLGQIVLVVIGFAKKGMSFYPKTVIAKSEVDALKLMARMIANSSHATIYSNRAAYLSEQAWFVDTLINAASRRTRIHLLVRDPGVDQQILTRLRDAGVEIVLTQGDNAPWARFTLVDEHRSSAESLAIARGTYPSHEITVFDHDSGPQVISLAKEVLAQARRGGVPWTGA